MYGFSVVSMIMAYLNFFYKEENLVTYRDIDSVLHITDEPNESPLFIDACCLYKEVLPQSETTFGKE